MNENQNEETHSPRDSEYSSDALQRYKIDEDYFYKLKPSE